MVRYILGPERPSSTWNFCSRGSWPKQLHSKIPPWDQLSDCQYHWPRFQNVKPTPMQLRLILLYVHIYAMYWVRHACDSTSSLIHRGWGQWKRFLLMQRETHKSNHRMKLNGWSKRARQTHSRQDSCCIGPSAKGPVPAVHSCVTGMVAYSMIRRHGAAKPL